ncbi:hypothetical protein ACVWXO_004628 [Bradyrhizobium sp. LM2.7]
MVNVLVVAEGLSAGPAASPILSPGAADIVAVMLSKFQMQPVCTGGNRRIPTATIYNRYRLQPVVIDRLSVAT